MPCVNMPANGSSVALWPVAFMARVKTRLYHMCLVCCRGTLLRTDVRRAPEDRSVLSAMSAPRSDRIYVVGKMFGVNTAGSCSSGSGVAVLSLRLCPMPPNDRPALIRHCPGSLSQADAVH